MLCSINPKTRTFLCHETAIKSRPIGNIVKLATLDNITLSRIRQSLSITVYPVYYAHGSHIVMFLVWFGAVKFFHIPQDYFTVTVKQPWRMWFDKSYVCKFAIKFQANNQITTTKQNTHKSRLPYSMGYTAHILTTIHNTGSSYIKWQVSSNKLHCSN